MDPSRGGKYRKRSPKTKLKKAASHAPPQQPQAPPSAPSTDAGPGSESLEADDPNSLDPQDGRSTEAGEAGSRSPAPPESLGISSSLDEAAAEEMLMADPTIATTPVAGHSVVDIQAGFQVSLT